MTSTSRMGPMKAFLPPRRALPLQLCLAEPVMTAIAPTWTRRVTIVTMLWRANYLREKDLVVARKPSSCEWSFPVPMRTCFHQRSIEGASRTNPTVQEAPGRTRPIQTNARVAKRENSRWLGRWIARLVFSGHSVRPDLRLVQSVLHPRGFNAKTASSTRSQATGALPCGKKAT